MIKYSVLILLSFIVFNANSQYKIVDSKTKVPISYAHINFANNTKGIIADFNGSFSIHSSFNAQDTIIISCIGYISRPTLVKSITNNNFIELEPSLHLLSEVVISANRTKYHIKKMGVTKKPNKSKFADYAGTAKNGNEKATWIPNDYSIQGYLKAINIFVSDLGCPDAHFRIHVYDCNPFETKPTKEFTKSNIIASGESGNQWINIDMSKEQIQIGENGCFIGIEWFDSPKSKLHKDTIFNKGYVWSDGKKKDTSYSRVRSGNGVVLGAIYQKYRDSKNKLWYKNNNDWSNRGQMEGIKFYTTDTLPDGNTFLRTPDNHYQGVLCINIDVSFPKNKIDLTYEAPKKRKLNKLEKVKIDLFKYPQSNISELFSSLIFAFENNDVIYVFKYLSAYKEDQLNNILNELSSDNKNEGVIIPINERAKIIEHLKETLKDLNSYDLNKVNRHHFELKIKNDTYNLSVEDGLWKINPYTYRIYK
jgi:hypothetical protein